jgi:hypothetical protein
MTVKLNERAYRHAKKLVHDGNVVIDERDAWSEHQPSARQENQYIEEHGWAAYGRWYLGTDDGHAEDTKAHFKFPYSDFENVHRCGVLSAEARAAQNDYSDVDVAAAHLHGMLDALG